MNSAQNKAYEKKIAELHSQLEGRARELGAVESSISCKKDELNRISEEFQRLVNRVEALKVEIAVTDSTLDRKLKERSSLMKEVANQIGERESYKKSLISEISNLETKLSKLKTEEKKYSKTEKDLNVLVAKAEAANEKLVKIKKESAVEKENIKLESEKLKLAKQDFFNLKKKQDKAINEFEIKSGRFEHYVRRLQKYYDSSGIKLQILDQFGIKNN